MTNNSETNVPVGDWTTGTLKIYHDEKIDQLKEFVLALRADDKEALAIALKAADTATDKAEAAQRRVNETQNEFRGTLKDQATTLMPRAESEAKSKGVQAQIESLQKLVWMGLGAVLALQIVLQFVGRR